MTATATATAAGVSVLYAQHLMQAGGKVVILGSNWTVTAPDITGKWGGLQVLKFALLQCVQQQQTCAYLAHP